MRTALITGITGQDGHHLAKLLLSKSYRVCGVVNGQRNSREIGFVKLFPEVEIFRGDLTDYSSLARILEIVQPDEVYNLGAISYVGMSFEQPELTANVTGLGALRLLEAIKHLDSSNNVKIYQASSSEMFGKVQETPQTELTPFYPRSPYGVAKVFAHHLCVNYREAYGMHISSGILFNHEGEFRGHEFVTRKITSNVARIALGLQETFSLGDLTPIRDWGYAGDYVEAMWRMTQQKNPGDYVVATGIGHSVRDFLELALESAGLEPNVDKYVSYDAAMVRPSEVQLLLGDASKAKLNLGWEPSLNFTDLVKLMVGNDLNLEK